MESLAGTSHFGDGHPLYSSYRPAASSGREKIPLLTFLETFFIRGLYLEKEFSARLALLLNPPSFFEGLLFFPSF